MAKTAMLAAGLAVAVPLLRPEWPVQQLARFGEEDRPPVKFATSSFEVPGRGIIATEVAPFLLVLSPEDPKRPLNSEGLSKFLDENTAWFSGAFFKYGAVVFRGFDVPTAQSFEQVVLGITTELETVYMGTSPRSSINGTTYVHTAADFPPHRTLPGHIEMSFRDNPPKTQMFYAHKVDHTRGGETPLTDFEGVWKTLKADARLAKSYGGASKLKNIRNNDDCSAMGRWDPLVQKCWQEMYKTSDRAQVMEKCREEQFECTFFDDWNGRLRMANVQPFVRKHPISGREVWFNHINVFTKDSMVFDYERTASLWGGLQAWWPMSLALYYRALFGVLGLSYAEADFGSSVQFADGRPIPEEDLRAFKRAVWRNTLQEPYQLHDIVIVDNMKVGHGREMYVGDKKDRVIMTAWSDNYPSKWFADGP